MRERGKEKETRKGEREGEVLWFWGAGSDLKGETGLCFSSHEGSCSENPMGEEHT